MCQLVMNPDKNGIELYFEKKPEYSIITALKEVGYRWHNVKKCWYAKQNERTMSKAQELSAGTVCETTLEPKVIEDFVLPCSLKIATESDKVEIINQRETLYFKDEKMSAHVYANSIHIVDLANALKNGKDCQRWRVNAYDDEMIIRIYNSGVKTFADLFKAIRNNTLTENVEVGTQKGSETFSPFVKVASIKTPTKWTRTHIWKAILSGQIWKGKTDYNYTDDYAYDYAYNYHEGCGVDLIDLAIEIIEGRCNGYSIRQGETDENGNTNISFSTYSYNSKTLIFNENFDFKKGSAARTKEREELEAYNKNLKAQVITLDKNDIDEQSVYVCRWISEYTNTGRYEIKSELRFGRNIMWFDEDNGTYRMSEQFISIEPYVIISDKFYTISDFYNRPSSESVYNDNRIINTGNWQHICTGLSLREMLAEGKTFDTIQENNISFEAVRDDLQRHANGTAFWMGVKDERNYSKELFNLNTEEMKVQNLAEEGVIYV